MSFSRWYRTFRMALKSLLLHRLRSGLTMLGIVFGVFSVIAMLAIGEGASEQAQQQVLQLGATNIICRSIEPPRINATPGQNQGFVKRFGLKDIDYELLSTTIPKVVNTVPIREKNGLVRYRDREMGNARIVGCTPDYLRVNRLTMADGRFLAERDDNINVAVLGYETARELFRYENPIGKAVTVRRIGSREGVPFRIVGVTKHRTASAAIGGSLSGQDFNKDVYVPLMTMRTHIDFNNQTFERSQGAFSVKKYDLSQITLEVESRDDVVPTAEVVRESLELNHPQMRDVAVVVPLELLKQADQIRRIFNVVLGSIAAISLVVGGIGIMNIMLATVTERTREIGIRRALGAKQRDITHQFLTETIVLAGTGGLIGILLGLATPTLFEWARLGMEQLGIMQSGTSDSELGRIFSGMVPVVHAWTLLLAFGISVGIGVLFGLYPARAAARLDPIEALRHE